MWRTFVCVGLCSVVSQLQLYRAVYVLHTHWRVRGKANFDAPVRFAERSRAHPLITGKGRTRGCRARRVAGRPASRSRAVIALSDRSDSLSLSHTLSLTLILFLSQSLVWVSECSSASLKFKKKTNGLLHYTLRSYDWNQQLFNASTKLLNELIVYL